MDDVVQAQQKRSRGVLRWGLLFAIIVLLALLLVIIWLRRPTPNRNQLALGEQPSAAEPIDISIQAPSELDGLSRQQVFDQRTTLVEQYPQLLAADYTPDDATFGDIIDGLPWWGMEGQFVHFSGARSIDGPSEESRFLMNPYILVAPDFWPAISYTGFVWDDERLTADALQDPAFPYTPYPQSVRWSPQARQMVVTYNTTAWLQAINMWRENRLTYGELVFDLIAYNARDFNLNYVLVRYDLSTNIDKVGERPTAPFAISHYIHQGGSCGYPGGCNNMSPSTPPIQDLLVRQAPAEAVIHLWADRPTNRDVPPDMVVVLKFE